LITNLKFILNVKLIQRLLCLKEFWLIYPNVKFVLFQLESQLGGDYSEIYKKVKVGSPSVHTLLSYFDIDLNIITLLRGERKVDEPIHKEKFFKPLLSLKIINNNEKNLY